LTLNQDKFDIKYYSFGEQTKALDSLTFDEQQTDPTSFINQIDDLLDNKNTPVLLVTDGNQTIGNSYKYLHSDNRIYPIVVGDTTRYEDLEITRINFNSYSFLDNKFPVEIFTLYKGNQNTESQIVVYHNKKKVYSKKIQFSSKNSTQHISILLPSEVIGNQYYQVVLSPLKDEKNKQNNRKDFSIEVVNQQTNILILSSFLHPDLGAIKKTIESNKQRKATIKIGGANAIDFSKYQMLVLYQPTAELKTAMQQINQKKIGCLIITGTKTDWRFFNYFQKDFIKNANRIDENYLALYNSGFSKFVSKDIGFESLPPLKAKFGKIQFKVPFQSLLFQKIEGIDTEYPLLALYNSENQKKAVLFGEGFWRWRMFSKMEKQSYQEFNDFWSAIWQYTASKELKQQLHLEYKKIRFSNEKQIINASLVDENFKIDTSASLVLFLKNKETKKTEEVPFSIDGKQYGVDLSNLKPGNYSFQVIVKDKNTQTTGSFKILDYQIEQQFASANIADLQILAANSDTKVKHPDQIENLLNDLNQNKDYQSQQISKKTSKALIDWYWLLGFIILSLSVEWFIRKYRGLI